jgi:hypothetical protein
MPRAAVSERWRGACACSTRREESADRIALDERHRHELVAQLAVAQHHRGADRADLGIRQACRRQARSHVAGEYLVVERDERNVVGDPAAPFGQDLRGAEGDGVVRGEDRGQVRMLIEDRARGVVAALRRPFVDRDARRCHTRLGERLGDAREAQADGRAVAQVAHEIVGKVADDADPAMPGVDQASCDGVSGGALVGKNAGMTGG